MDKYILKGIANYFGTSNLESSITGEIDVKDDYWFEGKISDSKSPENCQLIKGIFVPNNIMSMTFFKMPKNHELISLGFKLQNFQGESIEGNYVGNFLKLPYRIEKSMNEQLVKLNYPDSSIIHEPYKNHIIEEINTKITHSDLIQISILKK